MLTKGHWGFPTYLPLKGGCVEHLDLLHTERPEGKILDGRKRAFKKRTRACRNARFKNTSVSKLFLDLFKAMIDSVSVRFKNARVEKML